MALDPISRAQALLHRDDEHPRPLPPQQPDPPRTGSMQVQLLRTYPAKVPRFPFAPRGERSVARGYDKAVRRARRLVYLEDQYFWSGEVVSCFAKALVQDRRLTLSEPRVIHTSSTTQILVWT
ncbi:hypothetical protein [Arsenicicoccus sp. oral taxon 190]|uniref:hypothetical protein n=1 Tax=Arsenicicoccus sp. oral taxon 190 TaxID=1658671 RepID=UPI00067A230A|nr:hypothetical protein [Arsenicicoccus sp. oral taxon 190]AKT50391.1 hypothetical protein ADJ73_01965 [Arsenicicoccus sp. oral taxon 190]